MNISITNECNRRCQYCFQRDWYLPQKVNDKSLVKEMTVEQFEQVILWYMKSYTIRHDDIRLLGGEPLLHSNLDALIDVLRSWHLPFAFISNISVDTAIVDRYKDCDLLTDWLINADYTNSQRDLFIHNFKLLCTTTKPLSISTTLIPNSKIIEQSAIRLLELVKIYKAIRGNVESLNIRVSPATPNPCSKFELYDYSIDLCKFFNIVWSAGQTSAGFDCKVNYCELSDSAITAFRSSGIQLDISKCTPETCPVDILVDGTVIWCSSINNIQFNINDCADYNEGIELLKQQWLKRWATTKVYCAQCPKYNPAQCSGLCIAKNDKV